MSLRLNSFLEDEIIPEMTLIASTLLMIIYQKTVCGGQNDCSSILSVLAFHSSSGSFDISRMSCTGFALNMEKPSQNELSKGLKVVREFPAPLHLKINSETET